MLGDNEHRLDPTIFQSELYLGVKVDDPKNGVVLEQEPEMMPRFRIVPGLYSLRASEAKHALKADDAKLVNRRFPRPGK